MCVCVCARTVNNIIDESYIPGFIINTAVQEPLAGVCDGSLSHGRVQPTLHTLKSLPVFCVPGPGVHQRVDQAQAGSGSQESYTRTAAHGMLARVDRTCLGHI